ncbi:MAG: ubiquinol-cytochrome c reductase iron-sulfur subunit [Pseudonocardiales bacterium]|nr:ubiquinol-cytochrome c reductase iron-sulfur subunit [Pseudonocardiales bacterium]
MSTTHGSSGHGPATAAASDFDAEDPSLTRFDLVREGARRDGVEIVHYEPQFPVRGTKLEKRIERSIAFLLTLSGLFGVGFVVAYIWWPSRYAAGPTASKLYTPLLGLCLGAALLLLGFAIVTWAKKLLPDEVAVQERHDGPSPRDEQQLTGSTILNMVDEIGIKRRPLLKAALLLPAGGLGIAAAAPLVGSLIKNPNDGHILLTTGWNPAHNGGNRIQLVRDDGTPIRPEEVSVGGQMTVFPGIPGGATNTYADSPTLLIHLRESDAQVLRDSIARSQLLQDNPPVVAGMWQNFVAYSKICTHAGCPASLYEQQTNRLLCPCHQSQFLITNQAKPIFGPAHRKLPMLPIDLENGVLVAKSDFLEPVGPTYWERPI